MAIQISGTTVIDNSRNVTNAGTGSFSGKVTSAATVDGDSSTTLATKGYVDAKPAGATGGGSDQIFYQNEQTVTTNYTVPATTNAMSAGPITIDTGITVTITSGSTWTIV